MEIKNIIIVGGGSAGWMTAATLIHQFPDKNITLIESPKTPTVGVGESTLGYIKGWMHLLEIDESFMKDCDASYKLSIRFEDFYKKDYGHFHYPFGLPNLEGNNHLLNDWYLASFYKKLPITDYADSLFPGMSLVNNKRLFKNKDNSLEGFNFQRDVAYHFDATKFGLWLKNNYCIPRGVKYISEDIDNIKLNNEGIESLNNKHKADLFIDCTGFRSLLLAKQLKEPFDSYEDILPNNSAWATKQPYTDKEKQINPYTDCKAVENGWIWNIPLWSRMGTGYVYSDKFISDEDALKQFQGHIGTSELEFRNIKMRVGMHKRLWVQNVCAIGLSAGFIEPLESNGLFTVHEFLIKLVRTLKRGHTSQWDKDVFNAGVSWKQCSYNNNFRKYYPGGGGAWNYDSSLDVFYHDQPYPSWIRTEDGDWDSPVSRPTETSGKTCVWDESNNKWKGIDLSDDSEYLWNNDTNSWDAI